MTKDRGLSRSHHVKNVKIKKADSMGKLIGFDVISQKPERKLNAVGAKK